MAFDGEVMVALGVADQVDVIGRHGSVRLGLTYLHVLGKAEGAPDQGRSAAEELIRIVDC